MLDEGFVATFGVKDLVIVKQGSVVLVMPKEKAARTEKIGAVSEGRSPMGVLFIRLSVN